MNFQHQSGLDLVVTSNSYPTATQISNSHWPYAVDSNGDISVIHFPDSSAVPLPANASPNSDIEIIQTIGRSYDFAHLVSREFFSSGASLFGY